MPNQADTATPLLSADLRKEITGCCLRYPTKQAATLPALHLVNDRLGYVPPQAVVEFAELLELAPAQVQDTLSFYGFFKQDKPLGRYRVWVCRSVVCAACNGEEISELFEREAGHQAGRDHARRPRDARILRVPRRLRRRAGRHGQRDAVWRRDEREDRRVGRGNDEVTCEDAAAANPQAVSVPIPDPKSLIPDP